AGAGLAAADDGGRHRDRARRAAAAVRRATAADESAARVRHEARYDSGERALSASGSRKTVAMARRARWRKRTEDRRGLGRQSQAQGRRTALSVGGSGLAMPDHTRRAALQPSEGATRG